jgi:hypothetical protein
MVKGISLQVAMNFAVNMLRRKKASELAGIRAEIADLMKRP